MNFDFFLFYLHEISASLNYLHARAKMETPLENVDTFENYIYLYICGCILKYIYIARERLKKNNNNLELSKTLQRGWTSFRSRLSFLGFFITKNSYLYSFLSIY